MNVADQRLDYTLRTLDEGDVDRDPIRQFEVWLTEAMEAGLKEPTAMALATTTAAGVPSCRMVLLKGVDARGFTFFTNYESRKGRELAENPRAAVVFYWAELERQVRITGVVEKVSAEESEEYFGSRPRRSQLGAIASRQSAVLASREELERRLAALEEEYTGSTPIPKPEDWGGYRIAPDSIEFWQGRRNRLHDRLLYAKVEGGCWVIARLSP